jgi:hypothetical protein
MILNGVSMLSSAIGQSHYVTARYLQDNIPIEDDREAALRALRRRSEPKRQPTKAGSQSSGWPALTD